MSLDVERIKFRTELGRELKNSEVDDNFKFVANPWSPERIYTEGMIVYKRDTSTTDGSSGAISFYIALDTTTKGIFLLNEWEPFSFPTNSIFTGFSLYNNFIVNSTSPGTFSTATNALFIPINQMTLELIGGTGIQISHDISKNLIKFDSDLDVSFDSLTNLITLSNGNSTDLSSLLNGYWTRTSETAIRPTEITDKLGIGKTGTITANLHIYNSSKLSTVESLKIESKLSSSVDENILLIDAQGGVTINAAKNKRYKSLSYTTDKFTSVGDSQLSFLIANGITTNGTAKELFLDSSSSERISIATNSVIAFKINLVAIRNSSTKVIWNHHFKGVIMRESGSPVIVGNITEEVITESTSIINTWTATVTADTSNNSLKITVVGDNSGDSIKWTASVELTEISL